MMCVEHFSKRATYSIINFLLESTQCVLLCLPLLYHLVYHALRERLLWSNVMLLSKVAVKANDEAALEIQEINQCNANKKAISVKMTTSIKG